MLEDVWKRWMKSQEYTFCKNGHNETLGKSANYSTHNRIYDNKLDSMCKKRDYVAKDLNKKCSSICGEGACDTYWIKPRA